MAGIYRGKGFSLPGSVDESLRAESVAELPAKEIQRCCFFFFRGRDKWLVRAAPVVWLFPTANEFVTISFLSTQGEHTSDDTPASRKIVPGDDPPFIAIVGYALRVDETGGIMP